MRKYSAALLYNRLVEMSSKSEDKFYFVLEKQLKVIELTENTRYNTRGFRGNAHKRDAVDVRILRCYCKWFILKLKCNNLPL
jgi:hypothetical protein